MAVKVKCLKCGFESNNYRGYKCPNCGSLLEVIHDFEWIIEWENNGIWIFSKMLPQTNHRISLGEGWTPLIRSDNLFRNENIYFKDESRNPTGSFRDRAAALIVSDALDQGAKRLVVASDGNMGASIAAYSAKAGLPVTIYVPVWTDPEKILLMKAYGAKVIVSEEDLDTLLQYVERRARKEKLYNASSTYNILAMEGLKTIAYEIYLQYGGVPSTVYVPLGSGLTILSLYHGFSEMHSNNIIDHIPKLIGVETCANPVYSSIHGNPTKCNEEPMPGLYYRKPVLKEYVSEIIDKHGETIVVNNKQVYIAAKKLAMKEGLFVEPSSAVALAGALKIGGTENSIILLTGHGLKSPTPYTRPSRERYTPFPGSTKSLILKIISEKPGLTGYEIWKRLGLRISVQAVYQHLKELEKIGLIYSKFSENRKLYFPVYRKSSS